eukprot:SAG31_NODE_1938_length_6865_cov_15.342595_5_plen_71_part_00
MGAKASCCAAKEGFKMARAAHSANKQANELADDLLGEGKKPIEEPKKDRDERRHRAAAAYQAKMRSKHGN